MYNMSYGALNRTQLHRLAFHDQLNGYIRCLAEEKYITEFPFTKTEIDSLDNENMVPDYLTKLGILDQASLERWCQSHFIKSSSSLFDYACYQEKKNLIIDKLLEANGESAFLKYKDRLDRVLYSIIRVSTEIEAYHLYYLIDNDEITFADAATEFSQGIERRSAGIVGPVDLTTPHPEIVSRLKRATPGVLFEPFIADEWHVILSLLYRFESTYDDVTRKTLGALLFSAKVAEYIPIISNLLLEQNEFTEGV